MQRCVRREIVPTVLSCDHSVNSTVRLGTFGCTWVRVVTAVMGRPEVSRELREKRQYLKDLMLMFTNLHTKYDQRTVCIPRNDSKLVKVSETSTSAYSYSVTSTRRAIRRHAPWSGWSQTVTTKRGRRGASSAPRKSMGSRIWNTFSSWFETSLLLCFFGYPRPKPQNSG